MQGYKLRGLPLVLLAVFSLLVVSCHKEQVPVYDVNDVNVGQPGSDKISVKTDQEFISIAYSDLFGTSIPQDVMEKFSLSYRSFGDKSIIIDMAIRNFLNDPGAQIPTKAEMQGNPSQFVTDTYQKFLVRDPNEFEKWFHVNRIQSDTALTPEIMYYSFMTCEDYRFY